MPEEKSDLQQISSRELVEKYHELSKELPRSAHDQARKKLLESFERGPVRDETDASLFDRGRDETDASLIEQARQVKAEIKRRVQAGDAELGAIAVENLKSGFQGLPDKALVDSLFSAKEKSQDPKKESGASQGPTAQKWYQSSKEVLARRQIVLKNPGLHGDRLCKLFDNERIPLPERWESKYDVTTWAEAYKIKKARAAIQRIISTDKKQD